MPNRLYSINSTPQPGLNNATTNVFVGKVVGGSSAVNGMVFLRGTSDEYDTWGAGQLGGPNSTWDWKGLLPYFKKVLGTRKAQLLWH
jgi:choline dehydrogenase